MDLYLELACSPKLDMADADSAAECFQALEQVDFEGRSCWRVLGREGGRGLEGGGREGGGWKVEGGREGGREGEREVGREGGREGEREGWKDR